MTDMRVPSIGQAIEHSKDHLILHERPTSPSVRKALLAIAVCVVVAVIGVPTLGGWSAITTFITWMAALGWFVWTQVLGRWTVCFLAYADYFVVLRSENPRILGRAAPDFSNMSGRIVAVFEKSASIRPQERQIQAIGEFKMPNATLPDWWREVIVFVDGQMWVLFQTTTSPDGGLEILHSVRSFFDRNALRTAPSSPASPSESVTAFMPSFVPLNLVSPESPKPSPPPSPETSPPKRTPKGTLR